MSLDNWKLENDLCRCCHAEGIFKNLGVRFYNELGEEEIYSDMIRDNLGIDLTPVEGLLCEVTFKICDQCVLRLRDVTCFKRQVQSCEEKFRDMYSRNVFKVVEPFSGEIKVEPEIDVMKIEENADDGFDARFSDEEDDKALIEQKIKNEELRKTRSKGKTKAKAKPKEHVKKERVAKQKKNCQVKKKESVAEDGNVPVKKKDGLHIEDYITAAPDTNTCKVHMCVVCKVAYKRLSDLKNHILRIHLQIKVIKCIVCPETFMYHSQRKAHMYKAHKQEEPKKLLCAMCKREFRRKNTLAEHMMDVHIEKTCAHCDQKFVRKKYMFHLNEAHGVSMPTCGVCGLKTLKDSALIRHQRNVHLHERDIKCTLCDKRFYTKSNLNDHMITHNQERIFHCDLCDKAFARKECFKSHYRIHTRERPFSCKLCAVSFVQRASLRFHIKRHHPEFY